MARAADLVQGTTEMLTDIRKDKACDQLYNYILRLHSIEISCSTTSHLKRLPQNLLRRTVMK